MPIISRKCIGTVFGVLIWEHYNKANRGRHDYNIESYYSYGDSNKFWDDLGEMINHLERRFYGESNDMGRFDGLD